MLQDLEACKRFELAPIVDAVIELAELTQTEVPSLRAIGAVTSLLDETLAARRTPVSLTRSGT
jgi:2-dehydropantoate 2-reductase